MNEQTLGRRHFLKTLTAGAASLPIASVFGSRLVSAAAGPAKMAYDPAAKLEITVSEVEMRRNSAGRMLMARIYQPKGPGPFPVVLDLHGGAWNAQRPHGGGADGPRYRESGVLVVAIDMTLAPGSAVPGVRSGCKLRRALAEIESRHVEWRSVEVRRLRKFERRPCCGTAGHAPARSALQRHSVSRSAECRRHGGLRRDALAHQRPVRALPECGEAEARRMVKNHTTFFNPWETIHEGESAGDPRPPRENHAGAVPDHGRRARRQRAACDSGKVRRVVQGGRRRHPIPAFEGCEHEWVAKPGPQTDRAQAMVKAFIARQLKA